MHLSEISVSRPSVPERACHQAREVETGNVLHHAAAEREILATPVEYPHPEHDVAHRTGIGSARTGQACGNGATERRLGPNAGGSHASIWCEARNVATTSASRVPARAVTTSSVGS
jgi:hypothetical protein